MKNIIKYLSVFLLVIGGFVACNDRLDTDPTDKVSGTIIFEDETAAQTALDGIAYLLYQGIYVGYNVNHAEGYQSTRLAQELMGDDMIITNTNNWYGMDYRLFYTSTVGRSQTDDGSRSYNVWNMMYTIISNLNYITAQDGNLGQNGTEAKNIMAQAYALRAFAYFELIQAFQKTYKGNENAPGVPVYTEPTLAGTEGKPRGTVSDVYTQINSDMKRAMELYEETGYKVQSHPSHMDYYVAKGVEANIALVQERWQDAYDAATIARSRSGVRLLAASEILGGMNDIGLASNLWCMEVIADQSPIYYYYLDYRGTNGGLNQRKCISKWLYDQMDKHTNDARLGWFKDGNQGTALTGENVNYGQNKLMAKDIGTLTGDIIFMRAEEMLFIQAEAKARLGQYPEARNLLKELAKVRFTTEASIDNYNQYLDNLSNANTLPESTIVVPTNVLEEVLLQKRIELWGEFGRIKDILRLKQRIDRDYPDSNHLDKLVNVTTTPQSGAFLLKIPQSEFDGNKNILSSEQNPIN